MRKRQLQGRVARRKRRGHQTCGQQDDGMRRDTLTASGVAHAFGRRGLDVDPVCGNAHVLGHVQGHRFDVRPHARRLRDDGAIKVRNTQPALRQGITHAPKQNAAVDIAVLLVRIRKVSADIAEPGRTEQGIAHRMHQHVPVRMGLEALLVIDSDAAYGDMTAFAESMGIKTVANTHNFNVFVRKRERIITPAAR